MSTELIVVLDVDSAEEARDIVAKTEGCDWYKVGSQLFTRMGPSIVEELNAAGKNIMLDLKFHDIPNTVAKSCKAAADLGVGMFTLHASGAHKMISAAREAVEGTESKILAVTVLTSLNETELREEIGIAESPDHAVPRLAKMAVEAGAHGIVCSPLEIERVREAIGPDALIVTPGIRPAWASKDDQQRIMTPGEAAAAGSNFIVVGRPILKHEDPAVAVALIKEELK